MNKREGKVFLSLTSPPPQFATLDQVIRSLLAQMVKASKIVLLLAEKEFPERGRSLPSALVATVWRV